MVIVKCLKPIFFNVISPEKYGFVEGRKIMDGIFTAQQIIHSLKETKKPSMLLKLDLYKAYDCLNWYYLLHLLDDFGFSW